MLHLYIQCYFKPVTSCNRRSFNSPAGRQRQSRQQCALLEDVQTQFHVDVLLACEELNGCHMQKTVKDGKVCVIII